MHNLDPLTVVAFPNYLRLFSKFHMTLTLTTSMFMSFRGNVKQSIGSNPGRCGASNIITLWLRAILLSSSLQLGTRKLTATFGLGRAIMAARRVTVAA